MTSECLSLIRRFHDGDDQAFQALFEAHEDLLQARVARRMAPLLQRRVSVSDVLQEARIVAYERRASFEGTSSEDFRSWLVGIVDRRLRKVVEVHARVAKRASGREVSRGARMETANFPGTEPSPSQQAMVAELRGLAERALQGLSADYQEVIRLAREEGLPLEQIAERLGRSYEATKKLRQRAIFEYTEIFRRLRGDGNEG